tara:strand:- start:11494 stop:12102 length:609 start_codon:yes stop_codon:yes gene_type:complete
MSYTVIDNFLEKDKFKEIQKLELEVEYVSRKKAWPDNLWQKDGIEAKDMGVQFDAFFYGRHNVSPILHLQDEILSEIDIKMNDKVFVQSQFLYFDKSSILWHNDECYDYGISYYIHEEWEDDWGGELLLDDGQWIAPKPNRLVILDHTKGPIWHKTTAVPDDCPGERLTMQTFIQLDFDPKRFFEDEERIKEFNKMYKGNKK